MIDFFFSKKRKEKKIPVIIKCLSHYLYVMLHTSHKQMEKKKEKNKKCFLYLKNFLNSNKVFIAKKKRRRKKGFIF